MNLSVNLTIQERTRGIVYLVLQQLVIPVVLSFFNQLLPHPFSAVIVNSVFFILNFICVLGIFHRFLRKSLPRTHNEIWRCLRYAFLGIVFYEVLSYLITAGISLFSPDFQNVNNQNLADMAHENYFLLSFCTILLVPVTEECLFRGLFFLGLQKRGRLAAYGVSTLLFALIHVAGYVFSFDFTTLLLCFIQYLPAGILLGWAYEKSDSIFAPILMHMTINQLGILSMR